MFDMSVLVVNVGCYLDVTDSHVLLYPHRIRKHIKANVTAVVYHRQVPARSLEARYTLSYHQRLEIHARHE